MNGIIIIDKPGGITSHDVVSQIRRLTHIRRVGHTGTLDPLATGVLPICIGTATKVCDMLTLSDKTYIATITLGITTDTLDSEGQVISNAAVKVSKEQIKEVLTDFVGEIEQIPPMYSAIKQNGKKLYELARAGIEVERQSRKITINYIKPLNFSGDLTTFDIEVSCSKGTYIRTLCDDIGKALGTGAIMSALRRIKTGPFDISRAVELDALTENNISAHLIQTDAMFMDYPKLSFIPKQCDRIKNGVAVSHKQAENGIIYRVYSDKNEFLCISECMDGRLRIIKTFW